MTSKVWVKLRGSRDDAFKVEVDEGADIDDLKNAISAETKVEVKFIYSVEYSEEHEANSCAPSDLISTHGPAGSSGNHPFYYTTEQPAIRGKITSTVFHQRSYLCGCYCYLF